ncbi:hypothetical protein RIF29_42142 [Crotalaria pallida]|uniref:Uncharacterized protein n=1 Tax=Crotalaria pallida TaxID=3830 RepID=A0AAN9HTD1_CROPI
MSSWTRISVGSVLVLFESPLLDEQNPLSPKNPNPWRLRDPLFSLSFLSFFLSFISLSLSLSLVSRSSY